MIGHLLVLTESSSIYHISADIICKSFRGVFQSLIEKHFPAPDTQKTLDIFGLRDKGNSIFDDLSFGNILSSSRERRQGE